MKRLFLLLAAGSVAMSANAQERHASVMFNNMNRKQAAPIANGADITLKHATRMDAANAAAKTTTAMDRWYSYTDLLINYVPGYTADYEAPYMWNDTTSKDIYGTASGGSEADYNTLTSIAYTFDPFIGPWNDPGGYLGEMKMTTTNAYTVDSIAIQGAYVRNNNDITSVDTLIFAFTYGKGDATSDIGAGNWNDAGGDHTQFPYTFYSVDTLIYMRVYHDSLNNRAGHIGGTATTNFFKIPLHSTDTSGNFLQTYVLPTPFSVPAGNMVAASLTFKSGSTTFASGDTVFTGDATNPVNYGLFRPLVQYSGSGSSVSYPYYDKNDQNTGNYKEEGAPSWGGMYTTMYSYYQDASNGSPQQMPVMDLHVTCATCTAIVPASVTNTQSINSVSVYPNPANDVVVIAFNMSKKSDVSVSLVNMLGQVVGSQKINGTSVGKAVLNTSALPAGIYVYAIEANGERTTGRVVVAH